MLICKVMWKNFKANGVFFKLSKISKYKQWINSSTVKSKHQKLTKWIFLLANNLLAEFPQLNSPSTYSFTDANTDWQLGVKCLVQIHIDKGQQGSWNQTHNLLIQTCYIIIMSHKANLGK